MNARALVLFSGGQDSATCLAWALEGFQHVETVGFSYGQRHSVELTCRDTIRASFKQVSDAWEARLGDDHLVDLPALGSISDTALTREAEITLSANGLPSTFVPGRNLVFLTFAAAIAYRRGIRHLVAGVCETDFSGYPDCRDDTIKAAQVSLNLGMDSRFVIHTPLMWINKAATWAMALKIGGPRLVETIRAQTHTCYLGDRNVMHEWGFGCGQCPACRLRADGWRDYSEARPAEAAARLT